MKNITHITLLKALAAVALATALWASLAPANKHYPPKKIYVLDDSPRVIGSTLRF